MVIMDREN